MNIKRLFSLALLTTIGMGSQCLAHVNQFCTVGFYKTHPQFITSGSCTVNDTFTGASVTTFNQSTLVSALFPDADSCVGALTLLQLLQSPTSVCGTGNTLPGAEVILLRQAIARISNAANSSPPSCDAVNATIAHTNETIDQAVAEDSTAPLTALAGMFDADNNAGQCTLH
jgi:hypothetical protein